MTEYEKNRSYGETEEELRCYSETVPVLSSGITDNLVTDTKTYTHNQS